MKDSYLYIMPKRDATDPQTDKFIMEIKTVEETENESGLCPYIICSASAREIQVWTDINGTSIY